MKKDFGIFFIYCVLKKKKINDNYIILLWHSEKVKKSNTNQLPCEMKIYDEKKLVII